MFDADENQSFTKNSLQPLPVHAAKARFRHFGVLFSFLVCVLAPVCVSAWYLYERAADQYASRVGFSVRTQEVEMPTDMLGGLGALSSGTSRDSDILYEFFKSQEIVARVDAELDLRRRFSSPAQDPVFRFNPSAPIEELVRFWRRMVGVYYDSATGLIELRVRAFSSDDAVEIAQETLAQASLKINTLSAIAREDTTRHAREALDDAVARLKSARRNLTQFRVAQNIVDPDADVKVQMSLLGSLQQQLAAALIDLDLMLESTRDGDPRVANLRRRVAIIERRIEEERGKFGVGQNGSQAFSELIATFETLSVDLEFAQTSYLAALAGFDKAERQALQQSRYLAAYLEPTRPQSAEFPQRILLLGLIALFASLGWIIVILIYYSLRDRS